MERLKAVAVDIKESVFDNETEAIMYAVRDIYSFDTEIIFSIPVCTFSVAIKEEFYEKDLEQVFKWENLFQPDRKEKLKNEMKKIIENWDYY